MLQKASPDSTDSLAPLCPPPTGDKDLSIRNRELATLAITAIVALAFRIYSIRFFDVISTDGTTYALVAKQILNGNFNGVAFSGIYPLFIAAAGAIIDDLELAGRTVSIIFGTAVLIPVYLIGIEMFSRRVALLACIIAAAHPSFVFYSCEVMTQSTYLTIQLTGILMVWRLFNRPTVTTGIMAGAFLGLTYMTRPEGLLLFFALPFFPLLFNMRKTMENWQPAAAYSAAFFFFFILNVILVYKATGEWQISAKTDSALNDALSYYLNTPDLVYMPGYAPKDYLEIIRDHPDFLPKNIAKNIMEAWKTILSSWQWLLLAAGFSLGGFSRDANLKRLFILCSLSPLAVIILFYYIDPSYSISYLPIMLLLIASSLCHAEKYLFMKFPRLAEQKIFTAASPSLILVMFYAILILKPQFKKEDIPDSEYWAFQDNGRRADKLIGLFLKENLPPGKIMTRWARIAYYAQSEWTNIPAGIYLDEIVAIARSQGVRFLIADGLLRENRPGMGKEIFEPLFDQSMPIGVQFINDPNIRIKGLSPYLIYKNPRIVGVVVYDLEIK